MATLQHSGILDFVLSVDGVFHRAITLYVLVQSSLRIVRRFLAQGQVLATVASALCGQLTRAFGSQPGLLGPLCLLFLFDPPNRAEQAAQDFAMSPATFKRWTGSTPNLIREMFNTR